jgi:hypothetical protein
MKYLISLLIFTSTFTATAGDWDRDDDRYDTHDRYENCVVPEPSTYAAGGFVIVVAGYVFVRNQRIKKS